MRNFLLGSLTMLAGLFALALCLSRDTPLEVDNKVKVNYDNPTPIASHVPAHVILRNVIETLIPPRSSVVYITGEINENAYSVVQQIQKKGLTEKAIYLVIDSPGGSVIDGARIISAMESSKAPVNTICMSMCASMAAIIHQYGVKRLMVDRSFLMFHNAAAGLNGALPQMRTRLNFLERYVTKMDARIARRAGLSPEQFMSMFQSEMWLDAEDSTNSRFADGIVNVILEDVVQPFPNLPNNHTGYIYFNLENK